MLKISHVIQMKEIFGENKILNSLVKMNQKSYLRKNLKVKEVELTVPFVQKKIDGDGQVFNMLLLSTDS